MSLSLHLFPDDCWRQTPALDVLARKENEQDEMNLRHTALAQSNNWQVIYRISGK